MVSIRTHSSSVLAETSLRCKLHKARPHAWKYWAENAGLAELKPKKIIYVDSMFSLARAAEQGVGIALIPLPVSKDWLESGSLIPVHTKHLVTEDFTGS